jgi:hypothetical protein
MPHKHNADRHHIPKMSFKVRNRPAYEAGLRRRGSDRDLPHDLRTPLPFADGSIEGCQAQDVFEHLEYEAVTEVLDDVYLPLPGAGGWWRA